MNKDTDLIYEAYIANVSSNRALTKDEAAYIFECIIHEALHDNKIINESFGGALTTVVLGMALKKAIRKVVDIVRKDPNQVGRDTIVNQIIQYLNLRLQNSPQAKSAMINIISSGLSKLSREDIVAILNKYHDGAGDHLKSMGPPFSPPPLPSQSEISSPSQQDGKAKAPVRALPKVKVDSKPYNLISNESFTQKTILIEEIEIAFSHSRMLIELAIQKEAMSILNEAFDVLEEGGGINKFLDIVQTGLDIAGVEPTIGTGADAANGIISVLRAASTKEPDQRKKHLFNAAISVISLIPGADLVKLLKARKATRPLAKAALAGAKTLRSYKKGRSIAGKAALPGQLKNFVSSSKPDSSIRQADTMRKTIL